MSYCEVEQVQEEFKSLDVDDSTTAISTARIERFIEEADAEINSRIGLKFVVPVTGPLSLIILRTISIQLVAGRLRDIMKTKGPEAATSQATRDKDLVADARAKIEQIIKGVLLLPDATLVSQADGLQSFDVDNMEQFIFDKDSRQW